MKGILHIVLMALPLVLCCTREEPDKVDGLPPAGGVVFSAELPQTRIAMGTAESGRYPLFWTEGDAISVNGLSSEPLVPGYSESSACFSVSGGPSAPFFAAYPAGALSGYSDGSATIELPATQHFVAGQCDPQALLLAGRSETTSLSFRPLVAIFKITPVQAAQQIEVRKVRIESIAGEKLSGAFETDFETLSGGSLTYAETVSAAQGQPAGTPFFIAIPAGEYAGGLRIIIETTGGRSVSYSRPAQMIAKPGAVYPLSLQFKDAIVVATYNILRASESSSSRNAGQAMTTEGLTGAWAKAITATGADLIGFNEIDSNTIPGGAYALPNVCSSLPYNWELKHPNKITHEFLSFYSLGYNYANGFAYKPDVLSLEESGYVWLKAEGPGYYGSRSEAYKNAGSPERTCVYARFTIKASGRGFYFFVTHLATTEPQIANDAEGVNNFTYSKAGSAPCILVGDMNSAPGTRQSAIDKLKLVWTDAWDDQNDSGILPSYYKTYSGTQSGSSDGYSSWYTVEQFTRNHPERRIDHIMYKNGISSCNYGTVRDATYPYNGKAWNPSDHLPVFTTIVFD